MVEIVAWSGYNRSVGQGTCSEPFGHTFRAGASQGGHERCSVPLGVVPCTAASQLLNTVLVNRVEGYLTEYKLVKYKLSRAWDDEEIAAGRDQKEMANYAEMIPVSLCSIRLDGEVSAKGPARQAKVAARGCAAKKAVETDTTAGTTFLPQPKRKEKRKAAVMEPPARSRSPEEGVSDEPRAPKKRKLKKLMLHAAEDAAAVEEEPEDDLEPLLVRRSRQRAGASEERAPVAPTVDRSEAVMKMSAELGLIMVSDESDRSGGRTTSPVGLRSSARKSSADELGYAPSGMTGTGVFSPPIRTKGMGSYEEATSEEVGVDGP
ncbi:hypothetical protein Taro_022154 [Colocasia esculenta]|uniref:Uncharacterized protein n=1 Tax=Colocasia esculenta TaxID=4460 RepID=A0A843V0P3_COLES|nr:hypothetical protein [Colocasia esculenta]